MTHPQAPTVRDHHTAHRTEATDVRCRSPFDVSAALDILRRLSISDDVVWSEHDWPAKGADKVMLDPFDFEEEDADACEPCLYDPALFTSTAIHPASPLLNTFAHESDRDKHSQPLPPPPSTPRLSYSPVSPASTPSSSPRASLTPHSQPLPRSRPPSTSISRNHTHVAFPSISSTLSLLSERESDVAKRSGVIVTETSDVDVSRGSSESTILEHPPARRSSVEALQPFDGSPRRKQRPNLTLSSSTSTPQLRELAELAHTPASPILLHQPSLASLATSITSPPESAVNLLPALSLAPPASRWSIDSNDPSSNGRPALLKPLPETLPQTSPAKPRKRDRLLSFISRARAGSLGKQSTSPTRDEFGTISPQDSEFGGRISQPDLPTAASSRRTSHSVYSPQQLSATVSTTSTISVSDASLMTPCDSQHDVSTIDPFGSASPTFTPASFMPDMSDNTDVSIIDDLHEQSSPNMFTPPSSGTPTPTPSVFLPTKQESMLGNFARRTILRRKKKLIISLLPTQVDDSSADENMAAAPRQREHGLLKWCEGFGTVRRFERRENGNLHVYWRDSEIVDMVCRVGPQVDIEGAGRVNLTWRYVN